MTQRPLEITGLTRRFVTPTGTFTALRNVSVSIPAGRFVCIVGHSGCGKSTLLSIIAGLQKATEGGVCIDGKEVDEPGVNRGMVFQSPSLLPWLSSGDNVCLAAGQAFPDLKKRELQQHARRYLELVGVPEVYDQAPAELSMGTQQRVSMARALSLEPRFLLLDEPFSNLDSLTRFELQDILLEAWEQSRRTVVMVTHDIDEALYLADQIVLMTDGPESRVGEVFEVPFRRPRVRTEVLESPQYYKSRARIIAFLEDHAHQSARTLAAV